MKFEENQTEIKGAEPSRRLGSQTYGGSGRGGEGLRKSPEGLNKSLLSLLLLSRGRWAILYSTVLDSSRRVNMKA